MAVILTRYLYFLDECFYSLLFALINKTSMKEVMFWTGEIYYSGFEEKLWFHIWKIYYDFYAIKYPKFEKKINKLAKGWEINPSIENIQNVLNFLYYSKTDYTVFMMRMMNIKTPTCKYPGKLPTWLKKLELNKTERKLIRSIHDDKKTNILFYLNDFKDSPERCYEIIKLYYNTIHNYELKNIDLNSIYYTDKMHVILALICHLALPQNKIQHKLVSKKFDKKYVQQQIDFNEQEIVPLYKTLVHKRCYEVSPLIGIFSLMRYKCQDIDFKDILRLHWDYFAYNAPIWKNRVDKCNGRSEDVDHSLKFKTLDDFEDFYENFNYEPDEQSKEVQDKSIGAIDEANGKEWLNSIVKNTDFIWFDISKWKSIY